MKLNRTWTLIAFCLACAWTGVAAVMWLTGDQVSTPDKVLALMQNAPWHANPNLNDTLRAVHIDKVVASQNRLDFDQRRRMREDGEETLRTFFDSLSEPEQHRYVDGTVEQHLRKVLRILDSMKPEELRTVTARLRREAGGRFANASRERDRQRDGERRADGEAGSVEGDTGERPASEGFDDMLSFGLEMQYRDATPDRKLEMAQMLENMQAFLQGFRR